MASRYSKYIPLFSLAGDFFLLNLLFIIGFWWDTDYNLKFSSPYILFYLYLNLTYFFLLLFFGAYHFSRHTQKKAIFFTYLKVVVFYFLVFLLFFQLISLPSYYSRDALKFVFPLFFILLLAWKYAIYYGFLYYRKLGYNYRNVLLLGRTKSSEKLFHFFKNNRWHGYNCIGYIDAGANAGNQTVGNWPDLKEIIDRFNIDEIFLDMDAVPPELKKGIMAQLAEFPLKVHIIPTLGPFALKRGELVQMGDVPVIEIQSGPLNLWYNQLLKRIFDLLVSVIVMISILSWLSLLLYIIDQLGNRNGLFFLQKRTSIHGHSFTCIKYRSMCQNNQAHEKMASKNDKRVTRVGRFLRKTSLDELPQFINVFLGQMSIVGPRPHMLLHTREYREKIKNFMVRHTVKPGITGLAQINGYRGEIKQLSDMEKRFQFDLKYLENWSFLLDLKIMLLTVWVLLKGQKEAY